MTLIRAAARTMLASYFVASGVKALRNPGPLVPLAEPIADKVVPLMKQYAPDQVSGYIPEDAKTLVRVNAAAQVLGGVALASGKGRRVGAWLLAGSLVPSTAAKHPFWSRSDPAEKALDRSHFLKNISLLGGLLLAAGDTEGKPSLAWRAQRGGQAIAKSTRKATKAIGPSSSGISDTASGLAESALAGGATLVGAVVAGTRTARKQARKQLKAASDIAAKQAAEAAKVAAAAAKQAKKDAPKQLAAARKLAAERADAAKKAAAQARKDAPKIARAAELKAKADQKQALLDERQAAAQARKEAPKIARAAELKAKADRKQALLDEKQAQVEEKKAQVEEKKAQADQKRAEATEKKAAKVRKNVSLGEN